MKRSLTGGLAAALLALAPMTTHAQTLQQSLVDRATLAVQDMGASSDPQAEVRRLMHQARGVLVCPRIFKAGFLIGGQGGDCVLVGRTGPATWSDPAFYTLGSGSIGFQVGIQDSQLVLIVLTERGVRALLDTQFKIGAGASLAFATLGVGVEGGTTTALDADIVAFQINRGLFAGVSLDGGIVGSRSDFNQAYYGQPFAAQQIVLGQQAHNPGSDPLKEMLNRLAVSAPRPVAPAEPYASAQTYGQQPYPPQQPPPYQQQYPSQQQSFQQAPPYNPQSYGGGSVQAAPLPPPR